MDETRTLDALAEQVADVRVTAARIEAKLDAVITAKDDHEQRIRRLERMVWTAAGAATAAGGTVGALAARIFGAG